MSKIHRTADRIINFLQTEVWRLSKSELPKTGAFFLRPLRILLLTLDGFVRDNCALRASALTFYSLLSIVPVLAMAFGIAKGFGLDKTLEEQLYLRLAGQEEVLEKIITFSRRMLENTEGGLIAGIGVIVLLWSALKVMNHVEGAINTIWRVRSRSYIRRFTDYLAIMLLAPLLLILSSSFNVYITTQVTALTGKLALLRVASPVIFFFLKLLPFAIVWLLFILIYTVIPNTRVKLSSALIAGILAGTIYQLIQYVYINTQLMVSKQNAIYGSFAALPFFMAWLQLSWMTVLFGAEIAFAHQHASHYAMIVDYQKTSPNLQKRYALYILKRIMQKFENGDAPPSTDELAEELKLPFPLVDRLIANLVECGFVSAVVAHRADGSGYQPARDIHAITVADVLGAWDRLGQENLASETPAEMQSVIQSLESLSREARQSANNRLVKDL
jgi:membrane protein